jgi:hypothetical protein
MLGKDPEAIKARDKKINDLNVQYIVLLQSIIEKIEELEKLGFFVGQIKMFIKNAKITFEKYLDKIFKTADASQEELFAMSSRLLVIQERVEKALVNEYAIPVDERRTRAKEALSKYSGKYLSNKAIQEILEEFEDKNLFNF